MTPWTRRTARRSAPSMSAACCGRRSSRTRSAISISGKIDRGSLSRDPGPLHPRGRRAAGGGRPAIDHRRRVSARLLVSRLRRRRSTGLTTKACAVRFPRRRGRHRHVSDRLCRGEAASARAASPPTNSPSSAAITTADAENHDADAEPRPFSSRRPDRQPRRLSAISTTFWADLIAVYREELRRTRPRSAARYVQLDEVPLRDAVRSEDPRIGRGEPASIPDSAARHLHLGASTSRDARPARRHDDRACICAAATTRAAGWRRAATSRSPRSCSTRSRSMRSSWNTTASAPAASSRCGSVPANKTVVLGLVSRKTPALEPVDVLQAPRRRGQPLRSARPARHQPAMRLCLAASAAIPLTIDDERAQAAPRGRTGGRGVGLKLDLGLGPN